MNQFKILMVFLCVMGLFSETLSTLMLEAEVGDNVTIWCEHVLAATSSIFWYKQINRSVPLLVGCKNFRTSAPSEPCYFFNETERIVTSVQDKNSTLTITAVNISDTGLYYCSYSNLKRIDFSNSTFIQVKGEHKAPSDEKAPGCTSSRIFIVLSVMFGTMNVLLLCIMIFIKLNHRKSTGLFCIPVGTKAEDNEVPDSDSVHYAALHFGKAKTKRVQRNNNKVDSHVIYSSVGHSDMCT